MSTPPPPARIYGLIAAEADVAVLLRRGPAKRVLMVRWDLKNDEFELGQWLFDRAYEFTSDLSADGQFFTCQILDGKWHLSPGGTYAIVSRPPYFTALALWQQVSGAGFRFGGTGGWPASSNPNRGTLPPQHKKLLRDGDAILAAVARGWKVDHKSPLILTRPSLVGELAWRISWRKWPGAYWLNQEPLDAQWADVDHKGRLLLARQGKIYVRDKVGERELIDLNPLTFRPLEPPNWATEWP